MNETTSDGLKTINCTECGAGLNVLGGGRVLVHVCGYCGAELDAQDNYAVLRQFLEMQRPDTPFHIGMEGEIGGVPFTIIGTIGRTESYRGQRWSWVEHQVFSPTHGYVWLTWEENRVVFTRKIRQVPQPSLITASMINHSERRPATWLKGEKFKYYATGVAVISFVEGEFNWVPKFDDRDHYVSMLAGDRMLDIISRGRETEYEMSVLLDRDAMFASFGVDGANIPAPSGIHPLEPFERSSLMRFARDTAFLSAGACLILSLLMWNDEPLLDTGVVLIDKFPEQSFEVTKPDQLVEIKIAANVNNSWAAFEAELTDANGEDVAGFESGMEYYHGVEGGERWSEGTNRATTRLHLPAGVYKLQVKLTEAQVDWRGGRLANRVQVKVAQGVHALGWLWALTAGFVLTGGGFLLQRYWHEHRRWASGDWDDD